MSEVHSQEKSTGSNVVIAIVLLVVLVIAGSGIYSLLSNRPTQNQSIENETPQELQIEISQGSLEVLEQDGSISNYELNFEKDQSALEVMRNLDKNSEDFEFKYSESEYGAFVTEVNGYAADSKKNEFWKMVVNGQDAQVGISDYLMKENDVLRWEIDTF